MKVKDILKEDFYRMPLKLGAYRGPYDPRTMNAYPPQFKNSLELHDMVEKQIAKGIEPKEISLNPKILTATQDWLSDEGSNEDAFSEYADKPVVLYNGRNYYVLDGHHRSSEALRTHRMIRVYLFRTTNS